MIDILFKNIIFKTLKYCIPAISVVGKIAGGPTSTHYRCWFMDMSEEMLRSCQTTMVWSLKRGTGAEGRCASDKETSLLHNQGRGSAEQDLISFHVGWIPLRRRDVFGLGECCAGWAGIGVESAQGYGFSSLEAWMVASAGETDRDLARTQLAQKLWVF
jgi:hypothetical protein